MDAPIHDLTAHYRDTFEITYRLWGQRNRAFLALIIVIGVGAAALYRPSEGDSTAVIVVIILAITSLPQEARAELGANLPYPLVQAVILVTIFYLMVNLFHRSATVLRNYSYLSKLEVEIRSALKLPETSVAFTRESSSYWFKRPPMLGYVKYMYASILGGLLAVFSFNRGWVDTSLLIQTPNAVNLSLVAIDALALIPTAAIFVGYVFNALELDRDPSKNGAPAEVAAS